VVRSALRDGGSALSVFVGASCDVSVGGLVGRKGAVRVLIIEVRNARDVGRVDIMVLVWRDGLRMRIYSSLCVDTVGKVFSHVGVYLFVVK
jgi:hypothetical protein